MKKKKVDVKTSRELKDEFSKKLAVLCREYELENCVFGGEYKGELFGFHCVETIDRGGCNIKQIAASTFIMARMYQSGRENVVRAL